MGALTGITCSSRLLPARPQGVLCIRGRLAVGRLLRGRGIARLAVRLFGSHVVVEISAIVGRGRRIVGAWGRHNIPSAMRRHSVEHGLLLWSAVGAGCSRQWCSWDVPSKTVRPMSLAHSAGGVPAACLGCDHACAGCSNGRCRGTLTAPLAAGRRAEQREWRSIRRTGMGHGWSGTEPGAMQSREHSRSTQKHV